VWSYDFPAEGTDWRVLLVEVVGSRWSLAEELAGPVADQFVNGCGEKSDYVRGTFEELELGGVNPVAGKVGIVVDTKTVRKDDVLEAAGLSDVFVLWTLIYWWKMRQ